jgi:flagellar motor switch protein FliN/FliY
MAEDDDLGDLELGEEDDDDVVAAADAEALEEAISSVDEDGDEGDDELEPLAEEMLQMMEEEGGDDSSDSGEDVDQMMEMEMLKQEEGGGGVAALGMAAAGGGIPPNIERLMDVPLTVTIELGRTRDTIEKVMEYGDQSLIELDKNVGDSVDVLVNGELFARGEVVTVSEHFGVRITELVNPVQ